MKKIIHGDFNFFLKPCYNSSSSGENKYIFLCKKRLTKDVVAAKYKKVKPKCIFWHTGHSLILL